MSEYKHPREKVEQIESDLRKISGIVKQKGREILANFPITLPQFIALQWLNEEGDMTIGDLSNKMYLAFSTTTDLVDRMEKNNLLERVRDNKDRRVVRIHLLDEGRKIIEDVLERRSDYLESVLLEMDEDQFNNIANSLNLLYNAMDKEI